MCCTLTGRARNEAAGRAHRHRDLRRVPGGRGAAIPAKARIGWLAHGDTMPRHFFEEALSRLGWVEGENLTIERRFGGSAGEQESKAAADLVADHPDVIVALGTVDARPILALT